MDPEITLKEMLVCFAMGNIMGLGDAQESARSLKEWLDKGGFVPKLGVNVNGSPLIDEYEIRACIRNVLTTKAFAK